MNILLEAQFWRYNSLCMVVRVSFFIRLLPKHVFKQRLMTLFVQYEADWKMNENVILRTSLIEVWIQWVPHCLEKMVKFKRAPGHSPLGYQLSYYSNINYLVIPISFILIDDEQTIKRSLPVTIQTTIQYQSKVQASKIYQSLFSTFDANFNKSVR